MAPLEEKKKIRLNINFNFFLFLTLVNFSSSIFPIIITPSGYQFLLYIYNHRPLITTRIKKSPKISTTLTLHHSYYSSKKRRFRPKHQFHPKH
ncbi:hypothetical protein Glove_256g178 [Diversispora epigaea]|uniref:Uncharacterized protein n=1 Tax=Diversispora epigaea TaxID=1348612 RepID=A0A397I986_9GLOM|nr:hypothetical protein Glove_256g178 [Diversispora epigaea]